MNKILKFITGNSEAAGDAPRNESESRPAYEGIAAQQTQMTQEKRGALNSSNAKPDYASKQVNFNNLT